MSAGYWVSEEEPEPALQHGIGCIDGCCVFCHRRARVAADADLNERYVSYAVIRDERYGA